MHKHPGNYKNPRISKNNWKIDYLASPITDRSKPQCLICYEILSENKFRVKRHYLSKHSTSIKKISNQQRTTKNIETQEIKLKQQRISLKCLMTENSCLSIN